MDRTEVTYGRDKYAESVQSKNLFILFITLGETHVGRAYFVFVLPSVRREINKH